MIWRFDIGPAKNFFFSPRSAVFVAAIAPLAYASAAVNGQLGLKTVGSAIHPYPTQAEAIRRVGDLYNRTRLTPFVKAILAKWLAWRRR